VRMGSGIAVNYVGAAPGEGDYLITSTTAGKAIGNGSDMHPNAFAVCAAAGAGGEVVANLIAKTDFKSVVSTSDLYQVNGASNSDFVATLNGAPVGASVVYNAPSSGSEDTIEPNAAGQLFGLRIYNSTRGTYAVVEDVDTGTNTITVTDEGDVAAWQNGDTITARSQTEAATIGAAHFYDYEAKSTEIPQWTRAIEYRVVILDSGGADQDVTLHPWETDSGSKRVTHRTQVANIRLETMRTVMPLINQRFCMAWRASGAGTMRIILRLAGYYLAAP
jgi:hypothetical protein